MSKVKFSDVVVRANTKVDRFNTELEFYVGGEHIDSNEVIIKKRGLIAGSTIGPMFYFGFKTGQVLFVSRNPHLRKAGMVTFDGICSEKTFVLQTKDESILLQRYLPFILQSDHFWSYAEAHKSGSINFFINWSTLANYEFTLPDLETQRKLADVLWAMNDTMEAYKKLLTATDDLVKARFVEMFGDLETNPHGLPIKKFDEVAIIDANMTTDYKKYADFPHIGIDSIEKDTGALLGYRTVKEDNVISGKYIFGPKHIIYSKIRPALNKVALPDFEGLCSADAYPILPIDGICNREFLAHVMRSNYYLNYILAFSVRSQMPKVNRKQISGFSFPLPPIKRQEEFVLFIRQCDKSKSLLQKALTELTALYKRILQDHLV